MATITDRAVRLAFVEKVADITVKAVQNPDKKFVRVQQRIDKWLHECWAPMRKSQSLNIKAYSRRSEKIAGLAVKNKALSLKATITAALLLVEDLHDETPEKKRKPWHWLLVALADLYQLIDPGFGDPNDPEQLAGQVLGEEIQTL